VYYLLLGGMLFLLWVQSRRLEHRREQAEAEEQDERGAMAESRNAKRPRLPGRIAGFAGIAAGLGILFAVLLYPREKQFEIDVLDVGQGDGIYLCTSDAVSLFVDGGSSDVSQVGKYRILPFLKSRGVRSISYWFVSHGDADHISGLQEAIESGYRIDHLVVAKAARQEEKLAELVQEAREAGIAVVLMEQGDAVQTGTAELRCLYPGAQETAEDGNDLSLVLRFSDAGRSALLAGDISESVEQELVERGDCSAVDFFKANHHGSKYSNSAAFLEQIAPKITVASAGENNLYGHPSPLAVARIRAAGSTFYCTAADGQVQWLGGE
jgi:competence protein ComEC